MWRSIVRSALSVLFSLNLLIQGDARMRGFVGVVYAVLGAFVALAWWAQGHQEHPFARAFSGAGDLRRTDQSRRGQKATRPPEWAFLADLSSRPCEASP